MLTLCVLTVLAQKITWLSNQALLDTLFSLRVSESTGSEKAHFRRARE